MDSQIVDLVDVLDRVQDDRELLLELLMDFKSDYLKKRRMIDRLVQKRDFQQIKALCHSLKGAAGNVSITPMYNCFMILEYLALRQDVDLLKEVLRDLDSQFDELQEFIKRLKRKEI